MYIQPYKLAGRWAFRIRAKNHKTLMKSKPYSSWGKCWQRVCAIHSRFKIPINFRYVEKLRVKRYFGKKGKRWRKL